MPASARWNACECRLAMPGARQPSGGRAILVEAAAGVDMPSCSPARGRNATATIWRMNEPVHAAGDGLDTDCLITGATLVTLDGDAGYGVVEDGTLAWRDGVIRFAGPRAELPAELAGDAIDVGGDCITPGLVDCHTHAVFAGDQIGRAHV